MWGDGWEPAEKCFIVVEKIFLSVWLYEAARGMPSSADSTVLFLPDLTMLNKVSLSKRKQRTMSNHAVLCESALESS